MRMLWEIVWLRFSSGKRSTRSFFLRDSFQNFLTSYNAADAQNEKRSREDPAHHDFRQPAAHRASNVNSRNRAQEQTDEKPIVDVSELQMSESRNCHERNRVGKVRTNDFGSTKLRIEKHERRNADCACAYRSQRNHYAENYTDN